MLLACRRKYCGCLSRCFLVCYETLAMLPPAVPSFSPLSQFAEFGGPLWRIFFFFFVLLKRKVLIKSLSGWWTDSERRWRTEGDKEGQIRSRNVISVRRLCKLLPVEQMSTVGEVRPRPCCLITLLLIFNFQIKGSNVREGLDTFKKCFGILKRWYKDNLDNAELATLNVCFMKRVL